MDFICTQEHLSNPLPLFLEAGFSQPFAGPYISFKISNLFIWPKKISDRYLKNRPQIFISSKDAQRTHKAGRYFSGPDLAKERTNLLNISAR